MSDNIRLMLQATDRDGNIPTVDNPDTEREAIYDEKISPLLMEAGEIAKQNGMQLVAFVQYAGPWEFAMVEHSHLDIAGPAMRLAAYGARSKGNMDNLIAMLVKDDEKRAPNGSASIFMNYIRRWLKETK